MEITQTPQQLINVTSDMLVEAFESRHRLLAFLIRLALSGPTRSIAHRALQFEALVSQSGGQQKAARWLMAHWKVPIHVSGLSTVPENGPLLIVSNHAGWGDAIAIWASLPRQNIHTVVKANGLLRAMPNLVDRMIVVAENGELMALRRIIRCLREGDTVLLFPRGEIEPDPRLNTRGAIDSLKDWNPSLEVIARHVPELKILPAAVGGVLSEKAQNHPIAQLYRNPGKREYVGATLQLMFSIFQDVEIGVKIGAPMPANQAQLSHIQKSMKNLLSQFSS